MVEKKVSKTYFLEYEVDAESEEDINTEYLEGFLPLSEEVALDSEDNETVEIYYIEEKEN